MKKLKEIIQRMYEDNDDNFIPCYILKLEKNGEKYTSCIPLKFTDSESHSINELALVETCKAMKKDKFSILEVYTILEGNASIFDRAEYSDEEIEDLAKAGMLGHSDPTSKHVIICEKEEKGKISICFFDIDNNFKIIQLSQEEHGSEMKDKSDFEKKLQMQARNNFKLNDLNLFD